jgi:hypothetical protein
MTPAETRERGAALAATVTIVGLALVGTGPTNLGAFVTLAGLAGLMFAIHTYGRLGEDG